MYDSGTVCAVHVISMVFSKNAEYLQISMKEYLYIGLLDL